LQKGTESHFKKTAMACWCCNLICSICHVQQYISLSNIAFGTYEILLQFLVTFKSSQQ